MKVTMQHTVELEEVPLHVNRILSSAVSQLDSLKNIATSLDVTNTKDFVDNIDFIRKKMFSIDTKLDECAGLMRSYRDTLEQINNGTAQQTQQPPPQQHPNVNEAIEEPNSSEMIKQYKNFVDNMPDSMDEIRKMYDNLAKEKSFQTDSPIPPFPDLDLSALNKSKSNLEELLGDE